MLARKLPLATILFLLLRLLTEGIADAQERIRPSRTHHIVVLSSGESTSSDHPLLMGLRDGLKRAGYVEGINQNYDEVRATAQQYKNENIDVFVSIGSTDTAIAKQAGLTAPIIFMPTRDPLGRGFVKSLARPQTNLTGLAYEVNEEIAGKEMEIFKNVVSRLQRVLILFEGSLEKPVFSRSLPALRNVSEHLGISLIEPPVRSYAEAEHAVSALPQELVNGIFILCTNFFSGDQNTPTIAKKKKIPFYGCPSQVRKFGGLVSYAPDLFYIGRRGAWYVDRILKGAGPQELPVETPRKFELAINLKTADAIRLKIPHEVLQRADKVIR
jgi:putative tryptophan/tyrosine transport system substrate-binding protein